MLVLLFLVPLGVQLGCLCEIFLISWGKLELLQTSLWKLLLVHPIDFGLLCFQFGLLPGLFVCLLVYHTRLVVWSGISLWFWFAFPLWLGTLNAFSCACWPFTYLLWKNVCSRPLPIFYWGFIFSFILSCSISLYILDPNPLPDTWFTDILSQSVGCLITPLIVSFVSQKCYILVKSSLPIFVVVAFGVISRKLLPNSIF